MPSLVFLYHIAINITVLQLGSDRRCLIDVTCNGVVLYPASRLLAVPPICLCPVSFHHTSSAALDDRRCILVSYLVNVERLLVPDVSSATLVVNVIAVKNHLYGRWTSVVHNIHPLRGHHSHCRYCRQSAELYMSLTIQALYPMQYITAICSLQLRDRYLLSVGFNCKEYLY